MNEFLFLAAPILVVAFFAWAAISRKTSYPGFPNKWLARALRGKIPSTQLPNLLGSVKPTPKTEDGRNIIPIK